MFSRRCKTTPDRLRYTVRFYFNAIYKIDKIFVEIAPAPSLNSISTRLHITDHRSMLPLLAVVCTVIFWIRSGSPKLAFQVWCRFGYQHWSHSRWVLTQPPIRIPCPPLAWFDSCEPPCGRVKWFETQSVITGTEAYIFGFQSKTKHGSYHTTIILPHSQTNIWLRVTQQSHAH